MATEIPNIFKPSGDHRFMACVGTNGYSDGATYATGFFKASEAMLKQIVSSDGDGYEMDTLVYPILYSIRHGLELSIKHLLRSVHVLDEIDFNLKDIENHDLKALWETWRITAPFDRRLTESFDILDNAVSQIHEADPSGQEFRYHLNREQEKTLENKWTVDLVSVMKLLKITQDTCIKLFTTIEIVVEERQLKSFTNGFNREELKQLSHDLPARSMWCDATSGFIEVRVRYLELLGISSRDYTSALNFIQNHPEFAGNIGIESELKHLTENQLDAIVVKHIEYLEWGGPPTTGMVNLFDVNLPTTPCPDYSTLVVSLSAEAIGEFRALADIGRRGDYSERFPKYVENLTPYNNDEQKTIDFRHFFTKTTLLRGLVSGLHNVGMPTLAMKVELAQAQHKAKPLK